jgi:hypothetical protein
VIAMTRLPLRLAGRLVGLLVASLFLGTIASAVAAAFAKRRLVSIGGPEDDEVDLVTIFDALDFRSAARSFRRGSVLSWFAGAQLDLRGATLDAAGSDLEVRTVFAGTNVVVPAGWRVTVDGPAIFGANSGPAAAELEPGAPELRVRAVSVFGGTSVSAEAWDLAASAKTFVIAGQDGPSGAEAPEAASPVDAGTGPAEGEAAPGPAAAEAEASAPVEVAAPTPAEAEAPARAEASQEALAGALAVEPAPKRRRRRPAPAVAPAAEPAEGTPHQATEPG